MTKSQEDFMSMVFTVAAILDDNKTIWQNNLPLAATIAAIILAANNVTDLQSEQDKTHTGVTTDKKNKRTLLESNMVMVAHILAYLGATTNNAILQEQMDFAPSTLAHTEETKLVGMAKTIVDNANKYSVAALPFGLTPDLITALTNSYNDFSAVLTAPRVAIIGVSDATETISELIGTLRTLIKTQLDKGMMLYRDTPLYGLYQKARVIVNSPTNHLALTAAITNNNAAVTDAKITVISMETKEKVLRKSSPKGNIRVQNLAEGGYEMMVEKAGLTTQSVKFTIAPPDTTKLDVDFEN